jgi:hypothetical protein
MAKVTDVFVSGSMGNVVIYNRMGTNCIRIKRNSIQQTDATKKRGINFGIAAKAGSGLRTGLQKVMPVPANRSAQSRISGAISKWLGTSEMNTLEPCDEVPFIGTLAFVEEKGFYARFLAPLHISRTEDMISVKIDAFTPSQQISAPAKTVSVKLILSVSGCVLPGGEHTNHETHSIEIPYNEDELSAIEFDFHVSMPPKSLTVIAGRLIYNQSKGQGLAEIENPAFMAAGMMNAWYR